MTITTVIFKDRSQEPEADIELVNQEIQTVRKAKLNAKT